MSSAQIWFLTGSQHLYGPEILAQVASQSLTISGALDGAPEVPARVVPKPVLTDADAIRRVMLDASSDDSCIGVIAWMHTFSPAKMWISGLERLQKPLLHLHTQVNRELPWSSIDMDFMNLNQAAHGDRVRCVEVITGRGTGEAGGVLRRELPMWLNLPALRPLVLAASHPHAANTGAVRLLLRRSR